MDFREIVERHKQQVFNVCYSFVRQKEEAEDVTQEVFLKAWESQHKFRGESSLYTWLYRIAVNKSIDYIRKHQRNRSYLHPNDITELIQAELLPSPTPQDKERTVDMEVLDNLIQKLPRKQQVAFVLNKIEGLSYKETAQIMKRTVASVEGLLHRAKKNLKEWIEIYIEKNEGF